MIAIDTNVLVRYFASGDDAAQEAAALAFVRQNCSPETPALVVSVVLAEFVWVLQRSYGLGKEAILAALTALGENPSFRFEDEREFITALEAFRDRKSEFADCLIAVRAVSLGATSVHTFDRIAARRPPFQIIPTGA